MALSNYYPVKLHAIPRKGELIELTSLIDRADGRPPMKYYEVVRVVHKFNDIPKNDPRNESGFQFVNIYVKPSESKFFSDEI